MKRTIFVGLSGGVDSSVAALTLRDQGHTVVGVFIKVWHPDFLECNWEAERLDAMRVAAHLGIPFLTCDAEKAYKDAVADYFIRGYQAGETPNPDVMCNKHVKFGAFLEFAKREGADAIATGHYARVSGEGEDRALLRGVDESKDQSYFLWSVDRGILPSIELPIGSMQKSDVRALAKRHGLPTAEKKDSQGICFLGHVDIPNFLSHYTTLTPGDVLNTDGQVIGTHRGAIAYTLGQRHGFTINTDTGSETPHYVMSKDVTANRITVTTKPPVFAEGIITLRETNWLRDEDALAARMTSGEITIQNRYRQQPIPATIERVDATTAQVRVHTSTERPAIGQSCVVYHKDECLGGGIISGTT